MKKLRSLPLLSAFCFFDAGGFDIRLSRGSEQNFITLSPYTN